MKVYVINKPETLGIATSEDDVNLKEVRMWFRTYEEIEVLSLAEHDKQVRKEVCAEIRNRSAKSYSGYAFNLGKDVYSYTVCDFVLDEIEQGETK